MTDHIDQPGDRPDDVVVGNDQPTNQPPGDVDQPPTDLPVAPLTFTLEEAASALGISVNVVRQRIKRGTLVGIKTEAGWLVDMVATNQHPTTDRPSTSATNQTTNHGSQQTDHQPTIDLAPLVDHIATLEDQVQRLTEATTMWQIRARQAEEQLKALSAGTSETNTDQEPGGIDPEQPQVLQESDPAPMGLVAWWKRVWGG